MNVTSITTSTQAMWEEIRQEAMRNNQQAATETDEMETAATVTATNGQQVSVTSIDPEDTDGDGVVTVLERMKAKRKNAGTTDATPAPVKSALENVGPNTYERIRQNADRTYLAQAQSNAGGDTAVTLAGLSRSA
ncbi:hypothetical protein LJC26_01090 [Desulfovibrio sp. OttesenSCG-928-O18]|nr:hypothetical protein [Desulfovibrio sp. OttesenSCG-928-O18]